MAFIYHPYSKNYSKLFEEFKKRILSLSANKLEVKHVGSTSIPSIGGKGIIDVQIGINKWSEAPAIIKILKQLGFTHFHDIENHNLFVSTKAECEENDFHIHICRKGTKRYIRTLFFRDYLKNNPSEAQKYQELKKKLFMKADQNRQKYKELKNKYFKNFVY